MEKAVRRIIGRHREMDVKEKDKGIIEQKEKYVKTMKEKAKKIKQWLANSEDRPGKTGKPVKSNITDNEGAKIKTSHGVIQGITG